MAADSEASFNSCGPTARQDAHHDGGEDAEEGAEANNDAIADTLAQRSRITEEAGFVVILREFIQQTVISEGVRKPT